MPDQTYEPEDAIVEHLGEIKLADGRVFTGAIVTFPISPPQLPIATVWDKLPVRMRLRDERPKK